MTHSYFGHDNWLTDIPADVQGPMAGIAEYVAQLTAIGVHPMSIVQALALVLGQQTAVLVEEAVDRAEASGQVFAEAIAIATLENCKYFESAPARPLH